MTDRSAAPGKPAAARDPGRRPALVDAYCGAAPGSGRGRAARRVRHVGPSRLVVRSQLQRMARARDHAGDLRATGERRASTVRCSSASTRTRCPCRRSRSALEVLAANGVDVMIAARRRVHADAGGLARDPRLQPRPHARAGRRHRRHAVAQSAGQRRLQVQPAERRPGRHRRHRLDRSARQRAARSRLARRQAHAVRAARAARRRRTSTISSTPTSTISASVVDMSTRSAAPASAWASIRWAAPACITGRAIAERYGLDLTVVNDAVDPTFRFMTLDWDGRIRMDPSSPYAMQRLIGLKDRFDIAFACDTDHDRHGIVTPQRRACCRRTTIWRSCIDYLFRNRPQWSARRRRRQDGRQQRDDRPRRRAARPQALRGAGRLQMVRRRPARRHRSASPARRAPARRSCAATAPYGRPTRTASSPACSSAEITRAHRPRSRRALPRSDARARRSRSPTASMRRRPPRRKAGSPKLSADQMRIDRTRPASRSNACSTARRATTRRSAASRSSAPSGWFAARPSGTEDIYKIYAESFRDEHVLRRSSREAQRIVDAAHCRRALTPTLDRRNRACDHGERARPAVHQHDPLPVGRRRAEGEQRSSGHAARRGADGLCAVDAAAEAQSAQPAAGSIAIASCCRPGTARCCSTACCT